MVFVFAVSHSAQTGGTRGGERKWEVSTLAAIPNYHSHMPRRGSGAERCKTTELLLSVEIICCQIFSLFQLLSTKQAT